MKLKNVLIITFLTLTLIPIFIIFILLYKSGYDLSKESYNRNLIESINVQVDYITQAIENNMIADSRFANRYGSPLAGGTVSPEAKRESLVSAFPSYLEMSEDKISVSLFLDEKGEKICAIGETSVLEEIESQLPVLNELPHQIAMEFRLNDNSYSVGIITPVFDRQNVYSGSLVSIYNKGYIFKLISNYYKITDSASYICRENGEVINSRGTLDKAHEAAIHKTLSHGTFSSEGIIDTSDEKNLVSGYYKRIYNTPWYLVGFVEQKLIASFTNQFIWIYALIVLGVIIADVALSFYFSQKVVAPINALITLMDGYPDSINGAENENCKQNGYHETRYLRTKFLSLMQTILLVQHNFEGVYQLYQSSTMGDINIDIDAKNQTAHSNKEIFQHLMDTIVLPEGVCVVERFIGCFCEKDQKVLLEMLESMRDKHLSVAREIEIHTPHLGQKWFHALIVPMYEDDRLSRLFVQLRDMTSFKKQEFESFAQARRDPLTGLLNRTGFSDQAAEALANSTPEDLHGMLFVDMNYFKLVNDNFGHSAGDELLQSVGTILLETKGTADIASRFGGDEFAVFLPCTSLDTLVKMKDELMYRLVYPFQTKSGDFTVSASIGISTWHHDSPDTLEKLLKQADASMYQAKRELKDNCNRQ